MKLYKIKRGNFSGANANSVGIYINDNLGHNTRKSLMFIGKLAKKAKELFDLKGQTPYIGTNYGAVVFRYESREENEKLAKLLIKVVETEMLLKELNEISHNKYLEYAIKHDIK